MLAIFPPDLIVQLQYSCLKATTKEINGKVPVCLYTFPEDEIVSGGCVIPTHYSINLI